MGLAHQLAYRALRPLLFSLDAERAHDLVLSLLAGNSSLPRRLVSLDRVDDPVEVAGVVFPNRVGLAAGLDKEARCLPAFAAMGFGFIEVGSVAPQGETWPDPPRIYRLPSAQALINRIGLHPGGLPALCTALERCRWPLDQRTAIPVRLGINLACNVATLATDALRDYAMGLRATIHRADYFTINISNPNASNRHVPVLRPALDEWLTSIDQVRFDLASETGRTPPVFLKLSPDIDEVSCQALCDALRERSDTVGDRHKLRWGVIIANTTARRDSVSGLRHAEERGGLSGSPLRKPANQLVKTMRAQLGRGIAIIGTGGILSGDDARERIAAGADLIQIYTGLIYRGPDLVREAALAVRDTR
jgi:dihydroorotate dehydrogenase